MACLRLQVALIIGRSEEDTVRLAPTLFRLITRIRTVYISPPQRVRRKDILLRHSTQSRKAKTKKQNSIYSDIHKLKNG